MFAFRLLLRLNAVFLNCIKTSSKQISHSPIKLYRIHYNLYARFSRAYLQISEILIPIAFDCSTISQTMLRSCCLRCFGRRNGDGLLWHSELKPHASGEFSIAVVQANSSLEDQSQVYTSPSATYIGVYDGHGGPEASRFVNSHLFPYLHSNSFN